MFHFSHVSVRRIVATCRARTCRIVVFRITLNFHGSNPDGDGAEEAHGAAGDAYVLVTQSATLFFHIGSCQLYQPLRFAVVPCVTKHKIKDEFINFAGVSHPLNRFACGERLFHGGRSTWVWQLRVYQLISNHTPLMEIAPSKQCARARGQPITIWHGDMLEDELDAFKKRLDQTLFPFATLKHLSSHN